MLWIGLCAEKPWMRGSKEQGRVYQVLAMTIVVRTVSLQFVYLLELFHHRRNHQRLQFRVKFRG